MIRGRASANYQLLLLTYVQLQNMIYPPEISKNHTIIDIPITPMLKQILVK